MEAKGNAGGCPADASKAPTRSYLPSHDQREHRPLLYLLLFLALTASLVAAGYFLYRQYERNFRSEVELQLSSIAELKVSQLVQWRKELMGDASVFYKNKAFSGLVRRFLEKPADVEARGLILNWLERVQGAYPCYRIFILDAQGIERLAVPEAPPAPVASHLLQQIPEVLRSDKITFLDFYRDAPDRPIHLSLAIPVREESDGGQPLGVLVLHIDPAPYLYPYISTWPTPSRTGETLIIRRDGNDALFLNELKFQKDTALKLRVPLTSTDLPAVKAALGQEGIVEGIDYRGVRVIADVRAVPDSPWFLIARMDVSEVYAPLRARLWLMIGLVAVLLCGAGAGVGMIWRLQRVRFYRERYKATEEVRRAEENFRHSLDDAPLGVRIVSAEGETIYANRAILDIYGFSSLEELRTTPLKKRYTPESYAEFQKRYERRQRGEDSPSEYEVSIVRKNGEVRHLLVSRKELLWNGKKQYQTLYRDITERKRAEEALRESETLHRNLMAKLPAGISIIDPLTRTIESVNARAAAMFGAAAEQIVGHRCHSFLCPAQEKNCPVLDLDQEVDNSERVMLNADGSRHPILKSITRIQLCGQEKLLECFVDITERKQAEEALRASLREKEVLLREIHHRVKNNMQVISSLFNLQAGHTTNEECRGILKEGQTRIRSMSLVHEKLYQSRDLSKIDFAGYIQSLAVHLLHVYLVNTAQVRMETDFEDVSLDINSAVPCGLILNELISNALKHAFPEGRTGVIKIGLRRGPGGAVELRVADDGVGFPKGLDFRKAESFGLQIVNLLVDQLEATIDLDRKKGTAFTITFRELKYALRT